MDWCPTFLPTAVFNGVDSLVDVFTDVYQGLSYLSGTYYKHHVQSKDDPTVNIEGSNCTMTLIRPDGSFEFECFEQDIVWGILTLVILFLPGLRFYSSLIEKTTSDESGDGIWDTWASGTQKKLFLLASLLFPLTMVCVKIASVFYERDWIKFATNELTTSEVELQSLTQLSLQLFVVFQRADRFPTFVQWLQIASSFVTTSKGKADEFIRIHIYKDDDDYDEKFLEKLENLAKYMPYYTFLTYYRVASFSLILVVLQFYAILVYAILITIIMVVGALVAVKRDESFHGSLFKYWKWEAKKHGWYYPILLAVRSLFSEVHDEQQQHILFQGFWFLVNLFFIAGLNYFVNIGEGAFYNFLDLENVAIIKSRVYFNVVIGTVFFSGGLSFFLFFVQIRHKCEDFYERKRVNNDDDNDDDDNDE